MEYTITEITQLKTKVQKYHRALLEIMQSLNFGMSKRQIAAIKRKITNILLEE